MKTSPKPFCFVVMPFASEFDDIYQFGIKGACEDAGVYCERVDEQVFTESMLERIFNQISRADLIVADMTGKNPNVFYEVGYAHALGKRTVLLTQDANDIPFDLKHFPHIVYGGRINDLRPGLAKRIKHLAFDKPSQKEYELGLEVYWRDQSLSNGDVIARFNRYELPNTDLTIHNTSTISYAPGEFQVAVIAPKSFDGGGRNAKLVALPDGRQMHLLTVEETLFPGSFCKVWFLLTSNDAAGLNDVPLTIRVLSKAGYRDFPLRLLEEGYDPDSKVKPVPLELQTG
ncbi:hypothetical protein EGT07_23010 [Herbaspirillum sp. HC18]|nr:hypothetical protein EGT07_23010 [Herbaspirillum sp. HC18]